MIDRREFEKVHETDLAKLRNQLTPLYGLAEMVLSLKTHPEILDIVIETAKLAKENTENVSKYLELVGQRITYFEEKYKHQEKSYK